MRQKLYKIIEICKDLRLLALTDLDCYADDFDPSEYRKYLKEIEDILDSVGCESESKTDQIPVPKEITSMLEECQSQNKLLKDKIIESRQQCWSLDNQIRKLEDKLLTIKELADF